MIPRSDKRYTKILSHRRGLSRKTTSRENVDRGTCASVIKNRRYISDPARQACQDDEHASLAIPALKAILLLVPLPLLQRSERPEDYQGPWRPHTRTRPALKLRSSWSVWRFRAAFGERSGVAYPDGTSPNIDVKVQSITEKARSRTCGRSRARPLVYNKSNAAYGAVRLLLSRDGTRPAFSGDVVEWRLFLDKSHHSAPEACAN